MKRFATVLVVGVVALAGFGGGTAAADTFYGYTAPGTWFAPGQGYGSGYDNLCGRWHENDFSKASSAYGMITFIDPQGNWSNTVKGTGWLRQQLSNDAWTKKLHCKNISGSRYQGGCFGFKNQYQCA